METDSEYEAVRKLHSQCVDARDAALARVKYLEELYGHREGELLSPMQVELECKQKDIDKLRAELEARDIEDAVSATDYAALEAERDSEKENSEYLGNQWTESLRQLDAMKAERDEWKRRCEAAWADRNERIQHLESAMRALCDDHGINFDFRPYSGVEEPPNELNDSFATAREEM